MTSAGELRRRTLCSLTRPSYSVFSGDLVKLNDNANLFGVNPAALEVAETFDFARLWAYPSEDSDALRARLASELGVSSSEVIVGNGSDELLDIASKCFIDPDDVFCTPTPTFGMYAFYARVNMAAVREVPLRPDFSLDLGALLASRAKVTAICQPNNPTGNLFDAGAVEQILSESPGMVLVDEAYADFSGSSMLRTVLSRENGMDVRTFSKAYGMAGLRAGFAVARKETVDELRRVRTPFGLNSFTEAVAIGAIDNRAWVEDTVARMRIQREFLSTRMEGLGFEVLPSVCNFVTARCPVDGPWLVAKLRGRGVVVRDCSSFPLLNDHIRVTVGPRPLMERFLEAAATSIEEATP